MFRSCIARKSLNIGNIILICWVSTIRDDIHHDDFLRFSLTLHLSLYLTGYFADESVVDLNKQGNAIMKRLDISIVPSYEIAMNQFWATEKKDGR